MVDLTRKRIGHRRAIARAVICVGTALAKDKRREGNGGSLPQFPQIGVVLPDVEEIVMIDPTQGHMAQLKAGDNDAVRSYGKGLPGTVAARKETSPLHPLPSIPRCLLHFEPGSSVCKGTRCGIYSASVFVRKKHKCLRSQRALGDGELGLGSVLPAEAHMGRRICGKRGQFDLFQEESGNGFELVDVFPVNGDSDGRGYVELLQGLNPLNSFHEITLPPEGVVGDVDRAVDGDLDEVAAAG